MTDDPRAPPLSPEIIQTFGRTTLGGENRKEVEDEPGRVDASHRRCTRPRRRAWMQRSQRNSWLAGVSSRGAPANDKATIKRSMDARANYRGGRWRPR